MNQPLVMHALLGSMVERTAQTGSSYTCLPPVTTTDVDYLVLLKGRTEAELMEFVQLATEEDWELCTAANEEGQALYKQDPNYSKHWYSVRLDDINLIVTVDPDWYIRAVAATEVCKHFNVLDKKTRCNVFRAIRDLSEDHDFAGVLA